MTKILANFPMKAAISALIGFGSVTSFSSSVLAITNTYSAQSSFSFNIGGTFPANPLFVNGRGYDAGYVSASRSSFFDYNQYGTPPIPGFPIPHFRTQSAGIGLTGASASSLIGVNSNLNGTVNGSLHAYGFAQAIYIDDSACASSSAGVAYNRKMKLPFGKFIWRPEFKSVGRGTCAFGIQNLFLPIVQDTDSGNIPNNASYNSVQSKEKDSPDLASLTFRTLRNQISFVVTDPDTGKILKSGKFLDITNKSEGSVKWNDDDSIDFAIQDGIFSIDLDNEFIPVQERGSLFLEISNGIITSSVDTGIFDGFLPDVGSSGVFSRQNFGAINFNYNLGSFDQEVDFELQAYLGVESVPESSVSLFSLGIFSLSLYRFRKLRKRVNYLS